MILRQYIFTYYLNEIQIIKGGRKVIHSFSKKRKIYYEKIESLKDILLEEFIPEAIFERNFYLENGKVVSRILLMQGLQMSLSLPPENLELLVIQTSRDKTHCVQNFLE